MSICPITVREREPQVYTMHPEKWIICNNQVITQLSLARLTSIFRFYPVIQACKKQGFFIIMKIEAFLQRIMLTKTSCTMSSANSLFLNAIKALLSMSILYLLYRLSNSKLYLSIISYPIRHILLSIARLVYLDLCKRWIPPRYLCHRE